MAEIKHDIVQHIGILSTSTKGWQTELNLISWSGREPKYDIRDWSPEHDKMSKGITLSKKEILELKKLLATIDQ
ncbi:MAG: PC4/YdbC family ssDNA-binding protein [Firmicutes bacterium]|nr:PC4/YdbC family ssDNA-binding protein [Bacillota bacterium]